MNYKSAVVALKEQVLEKTEPNMIKLTNPFKIQKEKVEPKISNNRLFEIACLMRQRWEAYHLHNGTWYDYSDDGSWYSDEEEEWEEEAEEEKSFE